MRVTRNGAAISSRPVRQPGIGDIAFQGIARTEFLSAVEIVIDLGVQLFAVVEFTRSLSRLRSRVATGAAYPAHGSGVQAVWSQTVSWPAEVIGMRHRLQQNTIDIA